MIMSSAQDFVYEAIDAVNDDPSVEIKITKDPNFLLLDQASIIDSLTLVNLFVGIESLIEEQLGKTISIVNEDSFDSNEEPFKNIGNLVNYIDKLLNQ
jgi:D-alanine--poly(phosphoribitol) ligase subunit 2